VVRVRDRSTARGRTSPARRGHRLTSAATEFDHAFSVWAPIDDIWAALDDADIVVSAIPDARLVGPSGENSDDVTIEADVGLITLKADAMVTVEERDDAAHREVLRIVAETDGDELADATATIVLTDAGGRALAAVHTSVEVSGIGRLVSMDKLDEVANRTFTKFGASLGAALR
jgi:carbon monoxide dehydrogenase subunit G